MNIEKYVAEYNAIKHPNKQDITEKVYTGFENFVGTQAQINAENNKLQQKVSEIYKEEKEKHYAEKRKVEGKFKKELFEEFDITDNPKAELLYSKCYMMSDGFIANDIYYKMEELVELIVDKIINKNVK